MKKIRPMVRRVNTANDSKMNISVHDMEISLAVSQIYRLLN